MGMDQDLYSLPVGTSLEDSRAASEIRRNTRVSIISWRNNYVIDAWFMDKLAIKESEPNRPYPVSFAQLIELQLSCQVVIANFNNIERIMPGFIEWAIDENYYPYFKTDLKRTGEELSKLVKNPDVIYVYQKS